MPLRQILGDDLMAPDMHAPEAACASQSLVRAIEAEGPVAICGYEMTRWQSLRQGMDAST